ncbi:unnamed protein product, partial [Lymnaea stagnalis]
MRMETKSYGLVQMEGSDGTGQNPSWGVALQMIKGSTLTGHSERSKMVDSSGYVLRPDEGAVHMLDDHKKPCHDVYDVNQDVNDRKASNSYYNNPAINLRKRKSEVRAASEDQFASELETPIEESDIKSLEIKIKFVLVEGPCQSKDLSFNKKVYSEQVNLVHVSKVASGSFGIVDKVQDKVTKETFMRKVVVKGEVNPNEVIVPLLSHQHPNIIKVFGVSYIKSGWKCIMMEDAGISLEELVKEHKVGGKYQGLDKSLLHSIVCGILEGLSFLASKGFLHNDLKPANVVVKNSLAKLIDHGGATDGQSDKVTCFTPEYMSPEALKFLIQQKAKTKVCHEPPDHKNDVWAFFMISLYLVKGGHPAILYSFPFELYGEYVKDYKQMNPILIRKIHELTDPLKEFFFDGPDFLKHLLANGFKVDKDIRFSALQCLDYLRKPGLNENIKKRKINPDDVYKGGLDIQVKHKHTSQNEALVNESLTIEQHTQGLTGKHFEGFTEKHSQGKSEREKGTLRDPETKAQLEWGQDMEDFSTGCHVDLSTGPGRHRDAPTTCYPRKYQVRPAHTESPDGGARTATCMMPSNEETGHILSFVTGQIMESGPGHIIPNEQGQIKTIMAQQIMTREIMTSETRQNITRKIMTSGAQQNMTGKIMTCGAKQNMSGKIMTSGAQQNMSGKIMISGAQQNMTRQVMTCGAQQNMTGQIMTCGAQQNMTGQIMISGAQQNMTGQIMTSGAQQNMTGQIMTSGAQQNMTGQI